MGEIRVSGVSPERIGLHPAMVYFFGAEEARVAPHLRPILPGDKDQITLLESLGDTRHYRNDADLHGWAIRVGANSCRPVSFAIIDEPVAQATLIGDAVPRAIGFLSLYQREAKEWAIILVEKDRRHQGKARRAAREAAELAFGDPARKVIYFSNIGNRDSVKIQKGLGATPIVQAQLWGKLLHRMLDFLHYADYELTSDAFEAMKRSVSQTREEDEALA